MTFSGTQVAGKIGSSSSSASNVTGGVKTAITRVAASSNVDAKSDAKSKDAKSSDGDNAVANEITEVGKGEQKNSILNSDQSRLTTALKSLANPGLFGLGATLPPGMFGAAGLYNPYASAYAGGFGVAGRSNSKDAWDKSVASSSGSSDATTNTRGYGGYVGYQPLGPVDLSKVDTDGTKLKAMMAAIRLEEVGVATFNGGLPQGTEINDQRKEDFVKNFVAMYGNDEKFMNHIQQNGFKVVLADQINGETYTGGGVAGYYDPNSRSIVFSKNSLDKYTLGHEFAHARDHLVDGQMDGIYADVPGFREALQTTIGRIERGEGLNMSRIQYGYDNYRQGDGGIEVLATTAENYFNNNAEFRTRFPEMAEAYDQAFKPVFENLDGNIRREKSNQADQRTTNVDKSKLEHKSEKVDIQTAGLTKKEIEMKRKKELEEGLEKKLQVEIS